MLERQLVRQHRGAEACPRTSGTCTRRLAERGKRAERRGKNRSRVCRLSCTRTLAQSLALAGELEAAQAESQGFKDEIQAAVDDPREADAGGGGLPRAGRRRRLPASMPRRA